LDSRKGFKGPSRGKSRNRAKNQKFQGEDGKKISGVIVSRGGKKGRVKEKKIFKGELRPTHFIGN